jgi:hypothetical protein
MVYGWIRDRAGPLGGKWRPLVEKVGQWCVASRHLQVCIPRMCRLRTDGLAPVSKYWMYRSYVGDIDPVSLVACHQQVLGLSALLQWLCWERNWGGSRGPLSRAKRRSRKHFFSGAVHSPNPVDDSRNVAIHGPREIRMVKGHTDRRRNDFYTGSGLPEDNSPMSCVLVLLMTIYVVFKLSW